MPGVGIEPTCSCEQRILNPPCIPNSSIQATCVSSGIILVNLMFKVKCARYPLLRDHISNRPCLPAGRQRDFGSCALVNLFQQSCEPAKLTAKASPKEVSSLRITVNYLLLTIDYKLLTINN